MQDLPTFLEILYLKFSFHFTSLPEFLVEWFAFWKFNNFRIFSKLSQEISVLLSPFLHFRNFCFSGKRPYVFFKLNQLELGLGLKTSSIRFICMVCLNAVQSNLLKSNSTRKTPKCGILKRNVNACHNAMMYSHGVNNVNFAWPFLLAKRLAVNHRVIMYLGSLEST